MAALHSLANMFGQMEVKLAETPQVALVRVGI
jgi:hypothetical protein